MTPLPGRERVAEALSVVAPDAAQDDRLKSVPLGLQVRGPLSHPMLPKMDD